MDRAKFSKTLASTIVFITTINFLAQKFYWYYTIWWFDMLMHTLGGVFVALLAFYIAFHYFKSDLSVFSNLIIVLLIGLAWEVFEFYFFNHIAQVPFNPTDTLSDIFFDLLGGAFAIFYYFKNIMYNSPDTIE